MLLPIRVPSARGRCYSRGTGEVDSPVVNSTTSWPASAKPRASLSTTSSMPPYSSGGTGAQGGAIRAIRIPRLKQVRHDQCPLGDGPLETVENRLAGAVGLLV